MTESITNAAAPVGGFKTEGMMMAYSSFIPRLYNWCKSLGFEPGKIMPSRAFCSDESQGYPIIMINKHFGTFPFNHGMVGGVVATDRHGPHASHGQDMLIIQASHVGYEPETGTFGIYRRAQTTEGDCSTSCGKIENIVSWYKNEYDFARHNILLHNENGQPIIIVDNQLLYEDRKDGLMLHLERLVETDDFGHRVAVKILSTAKAYRPTQSLVDRMGESSFNGITPQPIGSNLTADMFFFKRNIPHMEEGTHHLEHNMVEYMPQIVTSKNTILTAAQINSQIEFDRTFRTLVKEDKYKGKKLLFISGLNIDISPNAKQLFPLTKFVPWAAYIQDRDRYYYTLEQEELVQTLLQQSVDNPDQIELDTAIQMMAEEDVNVEI